MSGEERTQVTVSPETAEKLAVLADQHDFETRGDAVGYAVNRVLIDDEIDY
ncbi:hypothetical protein [Halococcus saccharolyticus]|uniref:hypothetical protein n=1 Tax=Halococcus saccharolyticus TaxID=62319 RepID=UPI00145E101C|nr:hypothetical protein [Halococcus saccharolyticus]